MHDMVHYIVHYIVHSIVDQVEDLVAKLPSLERVVVLGMVCHAGLEPQSNRQGPTHSLLLTRVRLALDRRARRRCGAMSSVLSS